MKKTIITILLTVVAVYLAASMRAQTVTEGVSLPEPVKEAEPIKAVKTTKVEPKEPVAVPVKLQPVPTGTGNCEPFRGLISQYAWPVETAMKICACESQGRPTVVNDNPATGDYSVGLFQINLIGAMRLTRPPESWLKVAANNISYAYGMWQGQGWTPWTCYYKI